MAGPRKEEGSPVNVTEAAAQSAHPLLTVNIVSFPQTVNLEFIQRKLHVKSRRIPFERWWVVDCLVKCVVECMVER